MTEYTNPENSIDTGLSDFGSGSCAEGSGQRSSASMPLFPAEERLENIGDDDFKLALLQDAGAEPYAPEATDAADGACPAEEAESSAEGKVLLKYNGREQALPVQAVKSCAAALGLEDCDFIATLQKGMNYDRIKAQADSGIEARALELLAGAEGIPRRLFAERVLADGRKLLFDKEMQRLQAIYPDAAATLLRDYAEHTANEAYARFEAKPQAKTIDEGWSELFARFPELTPDAVPQEVFAAAARGDEPYIAMLQYELNRVKSRLAEQISAAAPHQHTAMPELGSQAAIMHDAFIEAFKQAL